VTARQIHPGELLDLADVLAGRRAGAGRPRTIELRRAISSAYYAIFHELVGQCTADMVRGGAGTPLQDARELADYDDTYDVSRRLALGHVDAARDAVARSQRMVGRGDPSYLLFLRLMIGAVKVAKRR
jgi:hypothetical protein